MPTALPASVPAVLVDRVQVFHTDFRSSIITSISVPLDPQQVQTVL